jgi:peptidoglycan hydrolase CwlO-like protein
MEAIYIVVALLVILISWSVINVYMLVKKINGIIHRLTIETDNNCNFQNKLNGLNLNVLELEEKIKSINLQNDDLNNKLDYLKLHPFRKK